MATHFFHSGMVGAPTNTNAAGSTLAIIRAVLSTGFNLLTPQSATVASGVMTLTYSAPHGYEDKVLLRLDGAPGGSVVRRVTSSAGSSSLTIPAPGFADGAVSGSLSTRVAPAGWEEVFTDAGVGVFRSTVIGPGSTRFFYRVADAVSGGTPGIVRGYESMTDANTGTGPFPSIGQVAGNGLQVIRSQDATARSWVAVVDGRTMYISLQQATSNHYPISIGDEQPFGSSDLFCAFASSGNSGLLSSGNQNQYRPRSASGMGTAVIGYKIPPFGLASGTGGRVYPSPIDGGLVFARPVMAADLDSQTGAIRSVIRGLMHLSADPLSTHWVVFPTVNGVDGRVLVVSEGSSLSSACIAFPIDEDWQ